jgi:tRNA (Thr-GGU) A37 N-methylase
VGVFATCSPARPNPILVTAVKVLGVHANVLTVQGLEAVDRSPVLDIKPYNRNYMEMEDLKVADWMERIEQERRE